MQLYFLVHWKVICSDAKFSRFHKFRVWKVGSRIYYKLLSPFEIKSIEISGDSIALVDDRWKSAHRWVINRIKVKRNYSDGFPLDMTFPFSAWNFSLWRHTTSHVDEIHVRWIVNCSLEKFIRRIYLPLVRKIPLLIIRLLKSPKFSLLSLLSSLEDESHSFSCWKHCTNKRSQHSAKKNVPYCVSGVDQLISEGEVVLVGGAREYTNVFFCVKRGRISKKRNKSELVIA